MQSIFVAGGDCHSAGGHLHHRVKYFTSTPNEASVGAAFDAIYGTPRHPPPPPALSTWALGSRIPEGASASGLIDTLNRRTARLMGVHAESSGVWEDEAPGRPGHGALNEQRCRQLLQDVLDDAASLLQLQTPLTVEELSFRPPGYVTAASGSAQPASEAVHVPAAGKRAGAAAGGQQPAKRAALAGSHVEACRQASAAERAEAAAGSNEHDVWAGRDDPGQSDEGHDGIEDDEDEEEDGSEQDGSEGERGQVWAAAGQGGGSHAPSAPVSRKFTVQCGTAIGQWDSANPLKFRSLGDDGALSAPMGGSAFEREGGRESCKKWRASVFVLADGGRRHPIGAFCAQQGLALPESSRHAALRNCTFDERVERLKYKVQEALAGGEGRAPYTGTFDFKALARMKDPQAVDWYVTFPDGAVARSIPEVIRWSMQAAATAATAALAATAATAAPAPSSHGAGTSAAAAAAEPSPRPAPPAAPPPGQCYRSSECTRPKGHSGWCNKARERPPPPPAHAAVEAAVKEEEEEDGEVF